MSAGRKARSRAAAAALVCLLAAPPAALAAGQPEVERTPMKGRPLLIVMNEAIDRLLPRLLARPTDEPRRLSVRDGLLGLGSYSPPGGAWAPGQPPLRLFAGAGFGNSGSYDPNTGLNEFTHLP